MHRYPSIIKIPCSTRKNLLGHTYELYRQQKVHFLNEKINDEIDQMSDKNKINDPFKKTHRSAVSVEGFPYSMNALKNAREGEGGHS